MRVCGKVHSAAKDTGFKLHGSITAIPKTSQDGVQVGQKEDSDTCVTRKILLEAEISGLISEVAGFQAFKTVLVSMENIRTGLEAVDGIHDQIEIVEPRTERLEKIGGYSAGRGCQNCRKLFEGDRGHCKFTS